MTPVLTIELVFFDMAEAYLYEFRLWKRATLKHVYDPEHKVYDLATFARRCAKLRKPVPHESWMLLACMDEEAKLLL